MDLTKFTTWLVLWAAVAVVLALFQGRRGHASAGLVLAYLVNLWMVHWVGAVAYALPWSPFIETDRTFAGLVLSTYGIAAFTAGTLFLHLCRRPAPIALSVRATEPSRRLIYAYIAIGCACYALLNTSFGRLPSVSAILSGGQNFVTVGLSLLCWVALCKRDHREMIWAFSISALLPIVTVVTQGFLGYGLAAMILMIMFVAVHYRPRRYLILAGFVTVYLGLSVYVAYFNNRNEIRAVVWGGAEYSSRLDVAWGTLKAIEPFDLGNPAHLRAVDERLNQNRLVGAAMQYTPSITPFGEGETLILGAVALVPRALWPEKPVAAGGMGLVTTYTGIVFGTGTSVGMGPVLESYINFGIPGVVLGLAVIGVLIAWIDARAASYLRAGDWQRFSRWFLVGSVAVGNSGAFAEVTASILGCVVISWLVERALVQTFSASAAWKRLR